MHRYSFLTWAPRGHEVTDQVAAQLVAAEGAARGLPPLAGTNIEMRPVDIHEDEAGFVHPGVRDRDFYVAEYEVDVEAIRRRITCPPT